MLAIRGNAVSSILSLNETGVWSFVAERPAAATNGAWDLIRHGQHLILMTSAPTSSRLVFNSLDLNRSDGEHGGWMSVEFGDVVVGHGVHPSLDDNGTVHMAYWETVEDDVVMLRMYADHDRDLVFDLIDAMPTVGECMT